MKSARLSISRSRPRSSRGLTLALTAAVAVLCFLAAMMLAMPMYLRIHSESASAMAIALHGWTTDPVMASDGFHNRHGGGDTSTGHSLQQHPSLLQSEDHQQQPQLHTTEQQQQGQQLSVKQEGGGHATTHATQGQSALQHPSRPKQQDEQESRHQEGTHQQPSVQQHSSNQQQQKQEHSRQQQEENHMVQGMLELRLQQLHSSPAQTEQQQQQQSEQQPSPQHTDDRQHQQQQQKGPAHLVGSPQPATAAQPPHGAALKPSGAGLLAGLTPKQLALVQQYNITLTQSAVQALAKDGLLFLSFANAHYTDFALVWVERARRLGIHNFMIGAMDDQLLVTLALHRVPTFSLGAGLPPGDLGWNTRAFKRMTRARLGLAGQLLEMGVQLAVTDIDAMWLRDPTPFFHRHLSADLLVSSDALRTTVGREDMLERWPALSEPFNIGIMLLRPKALTLVQAWARSLAAQPRQWDQRVFNTLLRHGWKRIRGNPRHLFLGFNATLRVGILPVPLFSNGHVYFVQRLPQRLQAAPYAVHAVHQFSGTPGKRHRFREAMLWVDGPEYYTPKGGLLTYEPIVPAKLLNASRPRTGRADLDNARGHLELVHHQLKQLRSAMALATVLGRTLILPKLWCGLDRWWAPHAGAIPGAKFDLPFQCPADHVLHLEDGVFKEWPAAQYGPTIHLREHSLLDNPAAHPGLVGSRVVITPCTAGHSWCEDGSRPASVTGAALALQERMDSERIIRALSSVAGIAVLDFRNINFAFGNFTHPGDWTRFAARMARYTDAWCCSSPVPGAHPAGPGRIPYDMLWDVVPHTDKYGKQWKTPWTPLPHADV